MAKSIPPRTAPRSARHEHDSTSEPIIVPVRAPALGRGSVLRIISPASASDSTALSRGTEELERLGYHVRLATAPMSPDGYFAGPRNQRLADLTEALQDPNVDALIGARGGYGTMALLADLECSGDPAPKSIPKPSMESAAAAAPKLVIGYSDITVLQAYLWARSRRTSLYGPMVAAGFDGGADSPGGYDLESFLSATGAGSPHKFAGQDKEKEKDSGESPQEWTIPLRGETLTAGAASGVLLGGCLTLLQTTLGTSWEIDTRGAILLLEDCGVKPYQVDRMLLHLMQAGKFRGVRGIVLGEFPRCDAPAGSDVTVRDVCCRLLGCLGIPVTFGAAIGHTPRPMLTVPLGVRARLVATGEGKLEILESAVSLQK